MTTQNILDGRGHLIGRILNDLLLDGKGRVIARYDRSANVTLDGNGHKIGTGDIRLIQLKECQ